jgi:hypothetical protein
LLIDLVLLFSQFFIEGGLHSVQLTLHLPIKDVARLGDIVLDHRPGVIQLDPDLILKTFRLLA